MIGREGVFIGDMNEVIFLYTDRWCCVIGWQPEWFVANAS